MLSWWFQKRWEKSFLMQYSDFLPIRKLTILTWNYFLDPLKFSNQNGVIFFLNIYSYVFNSIPIPGWIFCFQNTSTFCKTSRSFYLSFCLWVTIDNPSVFFLFLLCIASLEVTVPLSCFVHCIGMGKHFAWTFCLRKELEKSISFARCAGMQKEGPVSGAAPLLCPFLSRWVEGSAHIRGHTDLLIYHSADFPTVKFVLHTVTWMVIFIKWSDVIFSSLFHETALCVQNTGLSLSNSCIYLSLGTAY